MLTVPTATDPSGAGWLVPAAVVLLLASLCGYLVLQAWRRHMARQSEARSVHAGLPSELRLDPEPFRNRVPVYVALLCLTVPAGLAFGGIGIAVAAVVVVTPYVIGVERRNAARRQELMSLVTDRATRSSDQELRELIHHLEIEHGEFQTRHLRDLVAPGDDHRSAGAPGVGGRRISAQGLGAAAMMVWAALLFAGATVVEGAHRRNILLIAAVVGIVAIMTARSRRR